MASKITEVKITAITDASGDATNYSNYAIRGNIKAIYCDFSATAAATTDTIISDEYGQTILSLTDTNTDGWYYPRTNSQTYAGANMLFAAAGQPVPTEFTLFSRIKVVVAQGGATKTNIFRILVEEY